ncbi:hypothetical protein P4S72_03945 [Vibrio sp. PP-XX7]
MNVGNLSAATGAVQIRADGQVVLGTSSANTNLTVESTGQVSLSGKQFANQQVAISGQSIAARQATIASGDQLDFTAVTSIGLDQSQVIAGIDETGKTQPQAHLNLHASQLNLDHQTQLISHDQLTASVTDVALDSDSLLSSEQMTLAGLHQLTNNGTLAATDQLTVSGDTTALSGQGQINVTTADITANQLTLDTRLNTKTLSAQSQGQLDVTAQGQLSATDHLTLTGATLNQQGSVVSGGEAALTAQTSVLNGKTQAQTVSLHGGETRVAGEVTAVDQMQITATQLAVSGTIQSGGDTQVTATKQMSTTSDGHLISHGNLSVQTATLAHTGTMQVGGETRIDGTQLTIDGHIQSAGAMALTAREGITNQGQVSSAQNLQVTADSLTNSGQLTSQQKTRITLADQLTNASGGLISGATTTLSVPQIDNQGQLQALTDLGLTAQALTNAGVLVAGHDVTAEVAQTLSNGGQMSAGNAISLFTDVLENSGAVTAKNQLLIGEDNQNDILTRNTSVTNTGTIESQQGAIEIASEAVSNGVLSGDLSGTDTPNVTGNVENITGTGTHITAGQSLTLQAATLKNNGELSAIGNTLVTVDKTLTNQTNGLISGQNTVLKAQTITSQGQLQALTDLGLTAQALTNAGVLVAGHDVAAEVAKTLSNHGQISAGNAVNLFTNVLENSGAVTAKNHLLIGQDNQNDILTRNASVTNTGTIESQQGAIEIASEAVSNGVLSGTDTPNVTGNVENITGTGTHITAGQSLTLQAATLKNNGELSAIGNTLVTVDKTLTNQSNGLISGQNTVLKAQTITSQGQLQALTDLGLTAQALTNAGVLVAGHDVTAEVAKTLSNHGQISAGNAISLFTNVLENSGAVTAKNQLLIGKDNQNDILTRNTRVTNTGTIESQQGAIEIASEAVSNGVLSGTDTPNVTGNVTANVTGTGTHITAGQSLTLQAATLENNGELSALGNTQVTVDKTLTNQANGLISGQNTVLKAPAMTNQGQLQALTDLGLTTTALDNSGAPGGTE